MNLFGNGNMNHGLLNAATQMLAASGPSRTPTGFGQIAAQGLLGYQQGSERDKALKKEAERQERIKGLLGDAPNPDGVGPVRPGLLNTASPLQGEALRGALEAGDYNALLDFSKQGGGEGFKNVTQDDLGQWWGVNPQGQVQIIPNAADQSFTKFKTVQGTNDQGMPITSLVDPGTRDEITLGNRGASDASMTAGGFAQRMVNAGNMLSGFDDAAFSSPELIAGNLSNFTRSPEYRQYRNAADEWIRAKLRKESGAVIGENEMKKEYETYFPSPGDDPQTIAQKRILRDQATKAMVSQSKGAFENFFESNIDSSPQTSQATRQLNGKSYVKINGQWFEQ